MSGGAQTQPGRGACKPSHLEELIVGRMPPSTSVLLKEARYGGSVEGGCGAPNRSTFGTWMVPTADSWGVGSRPGHGGPLYAAGAGRTARSVCDHRWRFKPSQGTCATRPVAAKATRTRSTTRRTRMARPDRPRLSCQEQVQWSIERSTGLAGSQAPRDNEGRINHPVRG